MPPASIVEVDQASPWRMRISTWTARYAPLEKNTHTNIQKHTKTQIICENIDKNTSAKLTEKTDRQTERQC